MSHRASRLQAKSWSALPRWRRATTGWIFLHALFGLGILGLGQIVVTGMFILAVERGDRSAAGDVMAWASLGLALLTGLAAWLSFVYVRRSRAARWTFLLGLLVGGLAIDLAGQYVAERVLTA